MEDTLESLLAKVNARIGSGQYFYICNDPERALGLESLLQNFHIVHIDRSQYLEAFNAKKIAYFCWLEKLPDLAEVFRSSYKLIKSPEFAAYLAPYSAVPKFIQTFKISPAFEKTVTDLGATLVNTPGSLNRTFEDKLSQYRELYKLNVSLPKTILTTLGNASYEELSKELGHRFVVQFDRGHTGSGTQFIESNGEYVELARKYNNREVRVSEHISGNAYTVNACVLKQGIVLGGLSRQITGLWELTPQAGGTVGNDWNYRADWILGYGQLISEVQIIGEAMRAQGYLGMFGLDLILQPDGFIKFIEINARQPASIPMYTKIQLASGQIPLSLLHIAEFLGINYQIDVVKYTETALQPQEFSQIFVRALKEEVINTQLKSGFYRLQGDNAAIDRPTQEVRDDTIFLDEDRDKALMYYGPGYTIDQEPNTGLLLLTPVKGRRIRPNEEIGRIQIKQGAYGTALELKPWIVESLVAVRDYQI